mmetsp:Transcript_9084/g.19021  ORF Transcript_9084/g.19021 Transcript_9084/m.19021 type:complete len:83 (+) Transcript_9084:614-862(+)
MLPASKTAGARMCKKALVLATTPRAWKKSIIAFTMSRPVAKMKNIEAYLKSCVGVSKYTAGITWHPAEVKKLATAKRLKVVK